MRPILTFSENNIITLSGPFFTSVRISLIKPQFDTSPAVSGLGYQRRQGIGMIGMVCMKLKICSTGFHNSEIMIRAMSLHVQNLFKEQNGGSNIPYQKVEAKIPKGTAKFNCFGFLRDFRIHAKLHEDSMGETIRTIETISALNAG
jgi:hypothetical protein